MEAATLKITPLTQRIIDNTDPPASGFTTLRDHEQRGLLFRIWASGRRVWSLEYRSPVTAKNVRPTLPVGTLADARALAKQWRAAIAIGRDPAIENKHAVITGQEAHSAAVTVEHALRLYEAAVVMKAARATSRRARMASLRRTLEPFNELPIGDLKKGMIITRLDQVQIDRGPIARNRAQSEVRVWLGWCHNRDLVETIALALVRKEVKEVARERVLTDTELAAIMRATGDRSPFSDIIRTLLHTGMRRGEAANLQPRDLDFEQMTIRVRGEVAKNRQTRLIPMDEAIAPMLQERAERVGETRYIFGDGSNYRKPFSGWGKRTAALVKVVGASERWTIHDIRRSCATWIHQNSGVGDTVMVDDLLGHSGARQGVRGTYNRSESLSRQRPALRAWAIKLTAFIDRQEPLA